MNFRNRLTNSLLLSSCLASLVLCFEVCATEKGYFCHFPSMVSIFTDCPMTTASIALPMPDEPKQVYQSLCFKSFYWDFHKNMDKAAVHKLWMKSHNIAFRNKVPLTWLIRQSKEHSKLHWTFHVVNSINGYRCYIQKKCWCFLDLWQHRHIIYRTLLSEFPSQYISLFI